MVYSDQPLVECVVSSNLISRELADFRESCPSTNNFERIPPCERATLTADCVQYAEVWIERCK